MYRRHALRSPHSPGPSLPKGERGERRKTVRFFFFPSSPYGRGGVGEVRASEGMPRPISSRALTSLFPLLIFLLPLLLQAAGPPSAEQIERGRRIYVEGVSPAGGEITAVMSDEGVEVPASTVPCASCHGRDGKGRPE